MVLTRGIDEGGGACLAMTGRLTAAEGGIGTRICACPARVAIWGATVAVVPSTCAVCACSREMGIAVVATDRDWTNVSRGTAVMAPGTERFT
jgi:hypothetical protein